MKIEEINEKCNNILILRKKLKKKLSKVILINPKSKRGFEIIEKFNDVLSIENFQIDKEV